MKRVKEKGITLIALAVTIIILLILAGVSISLITGENGLIAKARLTAFITEMQGIKESVKLKQVENLSDSYTNGTKTDLFEKQFNTNEFDILDSLKKEILYGRAGLPEESSPEDCNVEDFDNLLDGDGNVEGIYIIDKVTGNGKEDTYVYDEVTDMVFKIPATSIAGKVYHSYETAVKGKGGQGSEGGTGETGSVGFIQEESEVEQVEDIYYYGPNLKGFTANNTYLVYYSADFSKTKEVTAEEYMVGGKQRQIEGEDGTYTLHDYSSGSKIWANIRTEKPDGNGDKDLEAYWVWIPRYAYKIEGTTMKIEFVGTDNKPLDPAKDSLEEGYEVHPAFTIGGDLKGIWMSKYEPSYKYLETSNKVLAPDMDGFDEDKTFIELYNGNEFEEVSLKGANLGTINNDGKWYNYEKQIWANIKTIKRDGNGKIEQEAWWVWVPRYAYKISQTPTGNKMDIIYIDLNNKPLDTKYGKTLPRGFEVHPSFTGDNSNLKGIWMSKYEPSYKYLETSNTVLAPDMSGFDPEKTYVELYNGSEFEQKLLNDTDLDTINNENKWYDYEKQVWANIKTVAKDAEGNITEEAWWVWIPRYAYKISQTPSGNKMDIIYIDETNKPLDSKYGDKLPEGYQVHSAFTGENSNLKGIWMSKYEPTQK